MHGRACDLGSPKQQAVLALLALTPGRVVSSDRLIDEIWGDTGLDGASSSLQVYVSRLRRAFRSVADQARHDDPGASEVTGATVVRRTPGYLLDVTDDEVDICRFERLTTLAQSESHTDARSAIQVLDEALAVVRGPALSGAIDRLGPSAAIEARRLDERVVAARELRVELVLAVGDASSAAMEAATLAAQHPLRESVHGLLMRARYRAGRQAEALEAYQDLQHRLAEELGADPGPELRRLHGQVLRHDPELDAPSPTPATGHQVIAGDQAPADLATAPLTQPAEELLDLLAVARGACELAVLAEVTELPPADFDHAVEQITTAGLATVTAATHPELALTPRANGPARLEAATPESISDAHGRLGLALAERPDQDERSLLHLTDGLASVDTASALTLIWDRLDTLDARGPADGPAEALRRLEERVANLPTPEPWLTAVIARRTTMLARRTGWLHPKIEDQVFRLRPEVLPPELRRDVLLTFYNRLTALVMAGDYDQAMDEGDPLLECSGRSESPLASFHMLGRVAHGVVSWARGSHLTAVSDLRRALSLSHTLSDVSSDRYGTPSSLARAILAPALVDGGNLKEALGLVEDNLALAEEAPAEDACILRMSAGTVFAQIGELASAVEQGRLTNAEAELHGLTGLAALGGQIAAWGRIAGVAQLSDDRERQLLLQQHRNLHATFRSFGVVFMRPIYDCLLAEAELVSGYPGAALTAAAAGIDASLEEGGVVWEARLRDVMVRAERALSATP